MPITTSSIPTAPLPWIRSSSSRDQSIAAFEREALLADVLGVQVALEAFGRGQLPEDVAPLLGAEAPAQAPFLELILQPDALLRVGHVGELGADVAAVDVFELREDVAQLHALRHRLDVAAGEEFLVEVRGRQPVVFRLERMGPRARRERERIDGGDQMPAVDPDPDEARDGRLAHVGRVLRRGGGARRRGASDDPLAHRSVRTVRRTAGGELREVGSPALIDARGIAQVLLVQGVEEVGVAAVEGCRFQHAGEKPKASQ